MIVSLLIAAAAAADADIVYCDSPNVPAGYYARDHLLAQGTADWLEVKNVKQELFYKFAALNQLAGFDDFARDLFHYSHSLLRPDESRRNHVWEEAAFGFGDLPPESIGPAVKALCPGPDTRGIEAIRKDYRPGKRVYIYDPKALALLGPVDNAQKSLLLTREWAENYTLDDKAIHELVGYYHDKELWAALKSSPDLEPFLIKLRARLRAILDHPRPAQSSICHRSKAIVASLEAALGNRCDFITGDDLATLTELKILDTRRPGEVVTFDEFEFRTSDLAGLSAVEKLDFRGIQWLGTSLKSGLFRDLPRLREIDFSDAYLTTLWPELFHGVRDLRVLRIDRGLFLDKILPGAFGGIFAKDSLLSLRGTLTQKHLVYDTFKDLDQLRELDLDKTYVSSIGPDAFKDLRRLRKLTLFAEAGFEQSNGAINAQHLPELEDLHLGKVPYEQVPSLPKVKRLSLSGGFTFFGEDFAARFPALEELVMDRNGGLFFEWPKSFSTLTRLRVFRANGVANALRTEKWAESAANAPKSLELIEFCHPQAGWHEVAYLAQEVHKHVPRAKIRARYNCQGDWIEIAR